MTAFASVNTHRFVAGSREYWQTVRYTVRTTAEVIEAMLCTCGGEIRLRELEARHVAEIPCGAKCQAAKGHSCECSCGGQNHGRSYAA